jgi:hypothetical protein
MNLKNCKLIDLPKITDPEGNLTPIEGGRHVPFEIKRVFYLYDVPGGATRAGHALRTCQQFVIAMSGVSMSYLMMEHILSDTTLTALIRACTFQL